jgi:hypothetical protein
MHHRDEVTSPAIAGAKNVLKNKSNEKASCLGKSELHTKGLVPLKHIVRSNDRGVVHRPVEPARLIANWESRHPPDEKRTSQGLTSHRRQQLGAMFYFSEIPIDAD